MVTSLYSLHHSFTTTLTLCNSSAQLHSTRKVEHPLHVSTLAWTIKLAGAALILQTSRKEHPNAGEARLKATEGDSCGYQCQEVDFTGYGAEPARPSGKYCDTADCDTSCPTCCMDFLTSSLNTLTLHSTLCTLLSALCSHTLYSAYLCTLHSALCTLYSAHCTLYSTLSFTTQHSLHSALYRILSALCTLHSASLCSLLSALSTRHSPGLRSALCTPAHCTLLSACHSGRTYLLQPACTVLHFLVIKTDNVIADGGLTYSNLLITKLCGEI
jgi:hypothetical protein